MSLRVDTRHLIKGLFIGLLAVIVINDLTVVLFYKGFLQGGLGFRIFASLTVDFAHSLPTYYNTILILIALILLGMISLHLRIAQTKLMYNWLLLTLAFLVLSLDESEYFHHILVSFVKRFTSDYQPSAFDYAWGMPYSALAVLFLFFLYRFLSTLPSVITKGFLVAGIIYVTGAVVIGEYGASALHIKGAHNLRYALLASYEESLEMIGLTLFIYYLLKYIRMEFKSFSLELS